MVKTETKPQAVLIRGLPAAVKAALEQAAAKNQRSLNGEIVYRLSQSVDGYSR